MDAGRYALLEEPLPKGRSRHYTGRFGDGSSLSGAVHEVIAYTDDELCGLVCPSFNWKITSTFNKI